MRFSALTFLFVGIFLAGFGREAAADAPARTELEVRDSSGSSEDSEWTLDPPPLSTASENATLNLTAPPAAAITEIPTNPEVSSNAALLPDAMAEKTSAEKRDAQPSEANSEIPSSVRKDVLTARQKAETALTPPEPVQVIASAEPESEAREAIQAEEPTSEERAKLFAELEKHSEILQAQANVVKLVAKIIEPSVVHIKSDMTKRGPHGERISLHDEGSGIITFRNECFYVLTNHHVIREALPENISVQFSDNRISHPKHVWFDEETDIAVLEMTETDLIPAVLGDSNSLEIGDFVLAVGSPFGLDRSVTFGIISAKGRRAINLSANVHLQDFLQTDAAINPGNSGGPLVNLRAEVIAMNTAIASPSGTSAGIAFSIPIRMVMLVADQLILYGHARRAYLGVTLDANFTLKRAKELGLPRANGACVTEVQPDSPASLANFAVGDVILKFNGVAVEDEKHLYNLVNLTEIGKEIPVTVYRNSKVYRINIRLQER